MWSKGERVEGERVGEQAGRGERLGVGGEVGRWEKAVQGPEAVGGRSSVKRGGGQNRRSQGVLLLNVHAKLPLGINLCRSSLLCWRSGSGITLWNAWRAV